MRQHASTLPLICLLSLIAVLGCGDSRRDRGRTDGAPGATCGPATCATGLRCCDHCTGSCIPAESGAFCPDDADPTHECAAPCRANGDCPMGQECLAPGESRPMCGIACMVEALCVDSSECDTGQVCAEYLGGCCSPGDPLSTQCVIACTPEACVAGEACAMDGICRPLPCDAGFTCPAHFTCRVGETGADGHGCMRDACESDITCGSGACVKSFCYDGPGACVTPMAVP